MGCLQEAIGLSNGFALTAVAYVIGGIIYIFYVDRYYNKQKSEYIKTSEIETAAN